MNPWESEEARKWEEWRLNQEAARRARDAYRSDQTEMFKSVIAFGIEAIRTSALVNGGATVASLALTGAIFQDAPERAAQFSIVVLFFMSGVMSAGLASGFSYLSQHFYTRYIETWTLSFDAPFVSSEGSRPWFNRLGVSFHLAAIASVIASYIALGFGAWFVWQRFQAFV